MNVLMAQYQANWIALVEAYADELREFAYYEYNKSEQGVLSEEAWFEYTIEDVDVDINVYVEDGLVNITVYPIEECATIIDRQVSL